MTDQADARGETPKDSVESPLVDLSGLALADVAELSGSVLGTALRAVMDAAHHPDVFFTAGHKESQVRS